MSEQVWDGVKGEVIIVPSFDKDNLPYCPHGVERRIYVCVQCDQDEGRGIYDISEMD